MPHSKSKKSFIELDDFISSDIKIDIGGAIDPKAKLTDFSHIKISSIDPRIEKEIRKRVERIRGNLKKMGAINN